MILGEAQTYVASYPGQVAILKEHLCHVLFSTHVVIYACSVIYPAKTMQTKSQCMHYLCLLQARGAPKLVYVWGYCFQPCKVESSEAVVGG